MTSYTLHDPTPDDDLAPQPDWPAFRASDLAKETTMPAVDWTALHAALAQPFPESELRYRAGATNRDKTRAQALPYVDARAYEDRLNDLVPGSWHVAFEPWGESRIICQLTIHGVMRSSTGEAGDSPTGIAGTSAEAQSFKRACAKFGLGRYLYACRPAWAPYNSERKSFDTMPAPIATSVDVQARSAGRDPAIGPERAGRLRQELRLKGLSTGAHAGFASQVIKRQLRDLASLTAAEAATVWRAAIALASSPQVQHVAGRNQ